MFLPRPSVFVCLLFVSVCVWVFVWVCGEERERQRYPINVPFLVAKVSKKRFMSMCNAFNVEKCSLSCLQ